MVRAEHAVLERDMDHLHNIARKIIEAETFDTAEAEPTYQMLLDCEARAIKAGCMERARVLRADADDLADLLCAGQTN